MKRYRTTEEYCLRNNRKYIGIDKEELYIDATFERLCEVLNE